MGGFAWGLKGDPCLKYIQSKRSATATHDGTQNDVLECILSAHQTVKHCLKTIRQIKS